MSEAEKVVELTKKPEARKKILKPKIDLLQPKDVVDVFRLFEKSLKEFPWSYPSTEEENPKDLLMQLYHFLSAPGFLGMNLKLGRRPVAQIIGQVQSRPFGAPRHYLFIWNFYMDAQFRKQGLMQQLTQAYFREAKRLGVHHWEANASDELTAQLERTSGFPVYARYRRIGGKTGV